MPKKSCIHHHHPLHYPLYYTTLPLPLPLPNKRTKAENIDLVMKLYPDYFISYFTRIALFPSPPRKLPDWLPMPCVPSNNDAKCAHAGRGNSCRIIVYDGMRMDGCFFIESMAVIDWYFRFIGGGLLGCSHRSIGEGPPLSWWHGSKPWNRFSCLSTYLFLFLGPQNVEVNGDICNPHFPCLKSLAGDQIGQTVLY